MTGSVELDPGGTRLLIRFPYREDLVALVKDLPGRRWDPRHKVWSVPTDKTELVYATFSRHLFEFAPEVMSILAGTLGTPAGTTDHDPKPRQPELPLAGGPAPAAAAAAMTILQLNQAVRDGLRERFPDALWVIGEIVDFDKSAGRAHRFFQLIDKAEGQPRAHAAVEVALFGGTAERLLPRLAQGEQPLTLRDGLEIRALVKIDLYPQSGRYQVVVQDIDPAFTLGKLALTREQILAELTLKGLADRNRGLGFAVPMLRIGVLSSPDSDGWNDFLRHLEESGHGFDVTLFPVRVQGAGLKPTMLAGLDWFAQHAPDFDVLCIVRGGGSRTDLAWFDDRDVAMAVARHPLKIVVGIGHQRDRSVLDHIAHSEKTPTAVAELLVGLRAGASADLHDAARRLERAVTRHLGEQRESLRAAGWRLQADVERRLRAENAQLATATRRLQAATLLALTRAGAGLRARGVQIAHACQRRLDRAASVLEQHATRHRLLDPARVLRRGYVLVRDAGGRIVPDAARLTAGCAIALQFRDGRAAAHVDALATESS